MKITWVAFINMRRDIRIHFFVPLWHFIYISFSLNVTLLEYCAMQNVIKKNEINKNLRELKFVSRVVIPCKIIRLRINIIILWSLFSACEIELNCRIGSASPEKRKKKKKRGGKSKTKKKKKENNNFTVHHKLKTWELNQLYSHIKKIIRIYKTHSLDNGHPKVSLTPTSTPTPCRHDGNNTTTCLNN